MLLSTPKLAAAVALFVGIVYVAFRYNGSQDEGVEFQEKPKRLTTQLESLKQPNKLEAQFEEFSGLNENFKVIDTGLFIDDGQGPSEEYESLRRRIYTNTKELWYYIQHELSKLMNLENKEGKIKSILTQIAERKRSLLSDQEQIPDLDGYNEWRAAEAANVSDLVQRRLKYLQNPADCRDAKKIICRLDRGCGFGCLVHHIVYCLIFAYATERTLIVDSKMWRYNKNGWENVFHPISDSCTSIYDDKVVQWPVTYDAKVIALPFIDYLYQKPTFLPLAIPKDLAHRIIRFNGDPSSWWIGQMVKYILKPKATLQKAINDTIAKIDFKIPIVGVHIRRTDKVGTEAAFHYVHEYMAHVTDYYDQLELTKTIDKRRVYLATDDPYVLQDAKDKYPDYEFLGDPSVAKRAATHRRYTPLSLTGLLVDLHMLSMCDYIVCTFSSNVGRLVYEMMQTNRVDASDSFFSLDYIYNFVGQLDYDRVAVLNNSGANQDVAFSVNDLIDIENNLWNGYGTGINKRNFLNGLIPWYKTADHLVLHNFPEYKQVPLFDTQQNNSVQFVTNL